MSKNRDFLFFLANNAFVIILKCLKIGLDVSLFLPWYVELFILNI